MGTPTGQPGAFTVPVDEAVPFRARDLIRPCAFRSGMTQKEVDRELFLLEEHGGFSRLPVGEQLNLIARCGNAAILDWYRGLYEMERRPKSWRELRELVEAFCTGEAWECMCRQRGQTWSQYL